MVKEYEIALLGAGTLVNEKSVRDSSGVAMDSLRSERRQTGSNVFGALASDGAILHPLSGPGDHRLTCGNVEHASFMCDA